MSGYEGETVRLPMLCPLCTGAMEEGILLDQTYGGTSGRSGQWMNGKLEFTWNGGVRTAGRLIYAVVTHRCTQCGYLASFATEVEIRA